MTFQGLQIGIELEILLTPQDPAPGCFKDLEHFSSSIAQRWNRDRASGMAKIHVDIDGTYEGGNENLEWSVTDDETLKGLENTETGRWALELTSPILQYVPSKSWRRDIQAFWNFLNRHMFIETDPKCGTHIHLSPLEGIWQLVHLKKICRSILWFESAFEVLVPKSRRGNHYCKSNRFDNGKFANMSDAQCLTTIEECQNNPDIVDLMNDGGNRYFAWNFVNLYYGGKTTIEFRRGPGVVDVRGCFAWVEVAVSFVQAAILSGSIRDLEQYEQNVEGLSSFILNNIQPLNTPQDMQQIFNGKSGSLMVRKIPTLTSEQCAVLEKKTDADKKKNLMLKKYVAAGMA